MPPREHEFAERLAFSRGVSKGTSIEGIALENIPGAVKVSSASLRDDRSGTDWWVEMRDGRKLSIDAKVRSEDWAPRGKDDLALETYSVCERCVPGWTRDPRKRTDYVLWLWTDTGRWCLVPFPMLCRVFDEYWPVWRHAYERKRQFTPRAAGGYHSECVFVPRQVVWDAILQRFAGGDAPRTPVVVWHEKFGSGVITAAFRHWRHVRFGAAHRWVLESFLVGAGVTP